MEASQLGRLFRMRRFKGGGGVEGTRHKYRTEGTARYSYATAIEAGYSLVFCFIDYSITTGFFSNFEKK